MFEEHGEGIAGAVGGDVACEPGVVGFVAADLGGAGFARHEQAGDLGLATGALGMRDGQLQSFADRMQGAVGEQWLGTLGRCECRLSLRERPVLRGAKDDTLRTGQLDVA